MIFSPKLLLLMIGAALWIGCNCNSEPPGSLQETGAAEDATVPDDASPIDRSAGRDINLAPADATVDPDQQDKSDAPPASIKVLFVGNSFTFVNDLPSWLNKLAVSSGKAPQIAVDSVTQGGQTFYGHATSPTVASKIKTGWSYVVLQGQSQEPFTNPKVFLLAAKQLASTVLAAKAIPVFFETWAYEKGLEFYNAAPWAGGSPKGMQKKLRDGYKAAVAASPRSIYAPVGDAWEATLAKYPSMPLHGGDGIHPEVHGTYLAACVFYALLTGRSPEGISIKPAKMSATQRNALQTMANTTVKNL